jgi:hypothetical protein
LEESTGPLPKRISFKYFPIEEQYVLGWRTRRGTEILLAIDSSPFMRYYPFFVIKGWNSLDVAKYEARTRQVNFWNIPVPLGEVLDLIARYSL